jgi:hypothetical protein
MIEKENELLVNGAQMAFTPSTALSPPVESFVDEIGRSE